MPETMVRYETISAAKIAAYWHSKGHLWVKTWLKPDGFCRSNMRFVGGGRGPIEVKSNTHPAVRS